jgi:pimeloyl-ACP methyl ester carboxylesterase
MLLAAATSLAASLLATPIVAQAPEAGSFLIRHGADTIAIENFTRGNPAGTVTSDLTLRGASRVHFTANVAPDGLVQHMLIDAYAPGASTPASHGDVTIAHDTVTVVRADGVTQRAATSPGALPWVNPSFVLVDQIVRRARALNTWPTGIPIFALAGGQTFAARVAKLGADSIDIAFPDVEMHVAVDAAGHAVGASIPAQNVTVQFVPGAHALGFAPPDYSPPAGAPYVAESVTVPTPAGFTLGGTLTLPRNRTGRVPAVVTITGSGLEDRDEAIPGVSGYRPFYQLADTLGRRGIAVLRLDDRGFGASKGDATNATSRDFANDTRAALAYLRTRPEIDPGRLFLVGHSEGGLIAPMIAASDPTLRGIVLMAGPADRGRDVISSQMRYLVNNTPSIPEAQRTQAYATQMANVDSAAAHQPWMREFLSYDPLPTARTVHVPVLILQGANDRQVSADQAARLDSAFRSGGNSDVTVHVFPGLDHLFLADPTGNPSGYGALPSKRIGPEVLGTIADWIAKHAS